MFIHVEMQKGSHLTTVCTILLIGLGSKIQENFAKQHVYESLQQTLMHLNKTDILCQEHKINVKFYSVGYCLQLL